MSAVEEYDLHNSRGIVISHFSYLNEHSPNWMEGPT